MSSAIPMRVHRSIWIALVLMCVMFCWSCQRQESFTPWLQVGDVVLEAAYENGASLTLALRKGNKPPFYMEWYQKEELATFSGTEILDAYKDDLVYLDVLIKEKDQWLTTPKLEEKWEYFTRLCQVNRYQYEQWSAKNYKTSIATKEIEDIYQQSNISLDGNDKLINTALVGKDKVYSEIVGAIKQKKHDDFIKNCYSALLKKYSIQVDWQLILDNWWNDVESKEPVTYVLEEPLAFYDIQKMKLEIITYSYLNEKTNFLKNPSEKSKSYQALADFLLETFTLQLAEVDAIKQTNYPKDASLYFFGRTKARSLFDLVILEESDRMDLEERSKRDYFKPFVKKYPFLFANLKENEWINRIMEALQESPLASHIEADLDRHLYKEEMSLFYSKVENTIHSESIPMELKAEGTTTFQKQMEALKEQNMAQIKSMLKHDRDESIFFANGTMLSLKEYSFTDENGKPIPLEGEITLLIKGKVENMASSPISPTFNAVIGILGESQTLSTPVSPNPLPPSTLGTFEIRKKMNARLANEKTRYFLNDKDEEIPFADLQAINFLREYLHLLNRIRDAQRDWIQQINPEHDINSPHFLSEVEIYVKEPWFKLSENQQQKQVNPMKQQILEFMQQHSYQPMNIRVTIYYITEEGIQFAVSKPQSMADEDIALY